MTCGKGHERRHDWTESLLVQPSLKVRYRKRRSSHILISRMICGSDCTVDMSLTRLTYFDNDHPLSLKRRTEFPQ